MTQVGNVEINQQSDATSAQFQVGEKLCGVDWQQCFHGFKFNDHTVLDQKIDSISGVEMHAAVDDWKAQLVFEMQAIERELVMQAGVICAFQHAGTQRAVDAHRGVEDPLSDVFVEHQNGFPVSTVSSVVMVGQVQRPDR